MFLYFCNHASKDKRQEELVSSLIHPPIDFPHIFLADRDYKIHETLYEFDLFEMYCGIEDKFLNKSDDMKSNFPHYIFPHTNNTHEFIKKCHGCYIPILRVFLGPTGETIFTITPQYIDQMMQAVATENATPFSHQALIGLYQKLDFVKTSKTLELFLTEDAPLPKKSLPYASSIFLERLKQIITVISYLLGYYSDE